MAPTHMNLIRHPIWPINHHVRDVTVCGRRAAKNATRKGKNDAIKTKTNSRFGKRVLQAYAFFHSVLVCDSAVHRLDGWTRAKAGGPDPENNVALQQVIEEARKSNVPKDIIERNLQRASDKDAANLTDEVVEVYGPGGTDEHAIAGFIMECLTDNRIRATTEIWTVVKKLEGKMADSGSVLFNFNRQGEIVVSGVDEDEAFEAAMETGADDVVAVESDEEEGQLWYKLVTQAPNFAAVRDAVVARGLKVQEDRCGLVYAPMALVEVEDDQQHTANEELYDRCLQIDDVDAIFTTCADVGRNRV